MSSVWYDEHYSAFSCHANNGNTSGVMSEHNCASTASGDLNPEWTLYLESNPDAQQPVLEIRIYARKGRAQLFEATK